MSPSHPAVPTSVNRAATRHLQRLIGRRLNHAAATPGTTPTGFSLLRNVSAGARGARNMTATGSCVDTKQMQCQPGSPRDRDLGRSISAPVSGPAKAASRNRSSARALSNSAAEWSALFRAAKRPAWTASQAHVESMAVCAIAPLRQTDLTRAADVSLDHVDHVRGECMIENVEIGFVVELERAVVEIG